MVRSFGFLLPTFVTAVYASGSFDLTTSLASKTPYWDQSSDPLGVPAFVKTLTNDEASQYTLVQLQSVLRHATRYPTKGNAGDIIAFVNKLQAKYNDVLPTWLRGYKPPHTVTMDGALAPAGTEEAKAFGLRARQRVGQAIPSAYSADRFILQHTIKPRTKDTATGFATNFFTNPNDVKYTQNPKNDDRNLRFFDFCPRYSNDVINNEVAHIETTKYKDSADYQKNFATLRAALNLPPGAELSSSDLAIVYSACGFDIALSKDKDKWCSLLSPEFIKSLEFADDLDTFLESSAGAKISYEISSVLLKDIYKYMKDFTQNKTSIVGNFRFVHGETTTPLMTLLGYTDKTPLLASFTPAQIDARQFRASRIQPFMANLEFGLYK